MKQKRHRLSPLQRMAEPAGFAAYDLARYMVGSWCPTPDGTGPATQVHLALSMELQPNPIVLRFKTPLEVDRMIAALRRHRLDVWPDAPNEVE